MNRRIALSISFIAINLMACCCGGVGPAKAPVSLPNSPDAFIAKFGKPDVDDNTNDDNPRPLMPTRWLVYRKQNTRVFFIPSDDHKVGERATGWQLLHAQEDDASKAILSSEETERRFLPPVSRTKK